jgi:methylthioribose-1-phosphate isomerase
MTGQFDTVRAVNWQDDLLHLLDQRLLPQQIRNNIYNDVGGVAQAITDMVVRGAPAIGIAAAFGVVLAARDQYARSGPDWRVAIEADLDTLAQSRPTAVNLFWALTQMRAVITTIKDDADPVPALLRAAQAIHDDDIAANRRMGELGTALIDASLNGGACAVLTHCNAGALATGGYGTALGVIRSAWAAGKISRVYADETRPWMQGARLTAWELLQDSIPVTLVAEGACAHLMKQGEVKWLIVGSDRIAANGDVANKIGTCTAAIVARHYGARVMVVAPTSTIDMAAASGADIPIESRDADELLGCGGQRVAAAGASAWNPVFDVTPAALVDAIVTEKGVVEQPDSVKMAALMAGT